MWQRINPPYAVGEHEAHRYRVLDVGEPPFPFGPTVSLSVEALKTNGRELRARLEQLYCLEIPDE